MHAQTAARQLRYLMVELDRWRLDPAVNDIAINRPDEVFVRSNGVWTQHAIKMDFDHCYDIAVLAGALNGQNVSESMPLLGADLPDGERLQAVLPPCVPPGTVSLTMRVHGSAVAPLEQATRRYNTTRWNKWEGREEIRSVIYSGLLDAYNSGDIVACFQEIVRLKLGMVLCGGTGAGKSTFLKTLVSVISPLERIITIENALEVDIVNQANHVRLLYSHGSQSTADVTQEQLLQAYLRMRPDRGCVGELRDPAAAFTYVSECLTGHPGSPSTIHGRDAPQAVVRLSNLFKASTAGGSFSHEMIKMQLGMAVDVIVPFNEAGGEYSINEIWLAPEAARRGRDIRELFGETKS